MLLSASAPARGANPALGFRPRLCCRNSQGGCQSWRSSRIMAISGSKRPPTLHGPPLLRVHAFPYFCSAMTSYRRAGVLKMRARWEPCPPLPGHRDEIQGHRIRQPHSHEPRPAISLAWATQLDFTHRVGALVGGCSAGRGSTALHAG